MDSSVRLFGRQRSVHKLLGGGIIADVMLWRNIDATLGLLLGMLASLVVFELFGYTLLSLVSSVMLLLISILFVWAKAAEILNRVPPAIPELHLSEEVISEAAVCVHSQVNTLLSIFHDMAIGKDSKLFCRLTAGLLLISVVGSWTDFFTLCYTSLVIVLTVPLLYDKYEDDIDSFVMLAHEKVRETYERVHAECFTKVQRWILEIKKLS